jgi:uncharacterized protein YceK
VILLLVSGCGTITAKDAIKGANAMRNIATLSKAGVVESASNCVKDVFDPSNRGSNCN